MANRTLNNTKFLGLYPSGVSSVQCRSRHLKFHRFPSMGQKPSTLTFTSIHIFIGFNQNHENHNLSLQLRFQRSSVFIENFSKKIKKKYWNWLSIKIYGNLPSLRNTRTDYREAITVNQNSKKKRNDEFGRNIESLEVDTVQCYNRH